MSNDDILKAACRGLSDDQRLIVTVLLRPAKTLKDAKTVVGNWIWPDVADNVFSNLERLERGCVGLELETSCEQETDGNG